jgi:glycosyltransferase involved in cell wall biosynthesis
VVVAVGPPVFAPLCVELARLGRRHRVVVDLHSGALNDRRWRWSFPIMRWLLRRADIVVVTNREIVEGLGLDDRLAVIHDLLVFDVDPAPAPEVGSLPKVVFPASGAADEPMDIVAGAAELLRGEAEVVTTGREPGRSGCVERLGFLPVDDYRALLGSASVVLALTRREATMQQAAYEALHVGAPIVCSDTRVLRGILGDAAVAVRHEPESLAAGVREALRRHEELVAAGRRVEQRLRAETAAGIAAVLALHERRGEPR